MLLADIDSSPGASEHRGKLVARNSALLRSLGLLDPGDAEAGDSVATALLALTGASDWTQDRTLQCGCR